MEISTTSAARAKASSTPGGVEEGDVDEDVARRAVVEAAGAGSHRRVGGDDRVVGLVLDPGGLDAVLGRVRGLRDDDRDRLADEAHGVVGEDGHLGGAELLDRPVQQGGDRRHDEVVGGEGGDHPGHRTGGLEVDVEDAAEGDAAAHELGVQLAGEVDVVDEAARAREQPGVLAAAHGGADEGTVAGHRRATAVGAVARRVVLVLGAHDWRASCTARVTMPVTRSRW